MNLLNIYNKLPFIFIIFAFGPYVHLGLGLRLEHLLIYPFSLLFFMIFLLKKQFLIKNVFVLFSIWLVSAIFLITRTLLEGLSSEAFLGFVAEVESFIQPLAVMSAFLFLTIKFSENEAKSRIITACKVLIIMLSLNSMWSIINIFIDLSSINSYFWGSSDGSVASNAITNGRYSGIFNQPMEAGVMYSLGLFTWIYLSENVNIFKLKYTVALFLMIIGGLLTVSKVFLFGGLALFTLGVVFNKRIWKLVFSLTFWSLIIGVPAFYYLTKTWDGLNYLLRFFDSSNADFLYLITAGRFGANAQQFGLFSGVWDTHPLIGTGFGKNPVYDSAFFYFFGNGGLIGLMFYLSILVILSSLSLKFFVANKGNSESKFFIFIFLLVVGASFGTPILTLNRVSVVLWVFIGLLVQYFYYSKVSSDVVLKEPIERGIKAKKKRRFKKYKLTW